MRETLVGPRNRNTAKKIDENRNTANKIDKNRNTANKIDKNRNIVCKNRRNTETLFFSFYIDLILEYSQSSDS